MITLNCNGRLLVLDKPLVMGIINATPDSFYKESRFQGTDKILEQAEQLLKQGADILDIGGQSTRPGSEKISEDEELKRVIEGITIVQKKIPQTFISIDTYYAKVARQAVDAGACIINDISGGSIDENMVSTVAALNVPYVLMHMRGTPDTMQQDTNYKNVTLEVLDFLIWKKNELFKTGIHDVIIDPGFGFGKTITQNFELLRNLGVYKMLQCPVILGISRKSTIYKTLDITADDALNGSTALHTIGLLNGADILRVHDVKEAKELIKLVAEYERVVNGQ
jgi:dihydropteroate synthase